MERVDGTVEEARRRAMAAAGVDPDMAPAEPPSDEEEAALQDWQTERRRLRVHGEACMLCLGDVKLEDTGKLREVTGWAESIDAAGGPTPTWRAETTGRVVCGACAETLTGPKQERLGV